MGVDEGGTLAALKAHRRELIDPKIAEYDGRIVKTTGDGLLLEFPSVVDAVRCAVDVQRGMAKRNAGVASDKRLDFRIGINVGDIIIDGGDIFGDGVNVAARIEGLADPGGICVSRVVRDQVVDKLKFAFDDLGPQEVKNIARPVDVFRVNLGGEVPQAQGTGSRQLQSATRERRWRQLAAGLLVVGVAGVAVWAVPRFWMPASEASPPVLSVAVLPLGAPPNDADASTFAEALTRYLVTSLPAKRRYGRVVVVPGKAAAGAGSDAADARELGSRFNVRYVLEGDVPRGGDTKTVNLRLVDADTGTSVWSGRETLKDADVASESSPTLRKLAARVEIALLTAEARRVKAMPPSALKAPELVLRAFAQEDDDQTLAGVRAAAQLVDEALRLEPDLVPALTLRSAFVYDQSWVDPDMDLDRAAREQDQYTGRALKLDPTDPAAWAWRATALAALGQWNAALEANATAIKLDPYEARWYDDRADLMSLTGRPAEAFALLDRASALQPDVAYASGNACEAILLTGQAERAIATCEKDSGGWHSWWTHLALAAAYANHGDLAKAADARAEALRRRSRPDDREASRPAPFGQSGVPEARGKALLRGTAQGRRAGEVTPTFDQAQGRARVAVAGSQGR